MNQPTGTKPTCTAIAGCLGQPWCVYCGKPNDVGRGARDRLAAMVEQLRGARRSGETA